MFYINAILHSKEEWNLSNYNAFSAGSDDELIAHIVNAVCTRSQVALYPGDRYGFLVGSPDQRRIVWD